MRKKQTETESRIAAARRLMVDIEGLMAKLYRTALEKALLALKPRLMLQIHPQSVIKQSWMLRLGWCHFDWSTWLGLVLG